MFLLTSAVDNEIKQYLAVDGRLHMDLDVPKTGLEENFTRSYYTSSGRYVWTTRHFCFTWKAYFQLIVWLEAEAQHTIIVSHGSFFFN